MSLSTRDDTKVREGGVVFTDLYWILLLFWLFTFVVALLLFKLSLVSNSIGIETKLDDEVEGFRIVALFSAAEP